MNELQQLKEEMFEAQKRVDSLKRKVNSALRSARKEIRKSKEGNDE